MNNNMKTNKETRMISSDEIFYAVLKDGTVVSNFREAVESMENEHALDLIGKVLEAHLDFLDEAKTFPDNSWAEGTGALRGSKVRSYGQHQGRC